MIRHFIIMSSSYSEGKRIGLVFSGVDQSNLETISGVLQNIKQRCDQDVPLSTHFIETDSFSWDSIKKYDPFFEEVDFTSSVSDFTRAIRRDRVLSGLDVATYILSKVKCTHLSLEKLVYYAYADYLCTYNQRLFEDSIYAFMHGPVVKSVYETYKKSGIRYLEPIEKQPDSTLRFISNEMPGKSRILFAKDGVRKINSIDKTLEKYGAYSAGDLVKLTHKQDSPWSHVDSKKAYQIISDDLIKKYHYVESIE